MGELPGLCNTSLWDFNFTWNTPLPDFTRCFQNTVLVWVPTLTLVVLSPWKIKKILSSTGNPQPWSGISIGKLVLNVILALLYVAEIVFASLSADLVVADILSPVLQLLSILIVIGLSLWARCRGVQTTVVLPTYWVLQSAANTLKTYSTAVEGYRSANAVHLDEILMKTVNFVIGVIQAVLCGFTEKETVQQGPMPQDKACPLTTVSVYSRLTFYWSTELFGTKPLGYDRLPPLCFKLRSETAMVELESTSNLWQNAGFRFQQGSFDVLDDTVTTIQQPPSSTTSRKSLLFSFLKMSWGFLFLASFFEVLSIGFSYTVPYLLKLLLDFMESDDFAWHGYLYGCALFLVIGCGGFAESQKDYFLFWGAARTKAGLNGAIYKKVFRMANCARKTHEPSHIADYMSTDSEQMFQLWNLLPLIWSVPLRLALGLYLLWLCLGPAAFTGLVVLAVALPLVLVIGRIIDDFQKLRMLKKDEKLKSLAEILHRIMVVKMYAWELPFTRRIQSLRQGEVSHLRRQDFWDTLSIVLHSTAPFVVALASFAVYVLTGDNRDLKPQTAFVSLVLIDLMRPPFSAIPNLLKGLRQSRASLRRLEEFFDSEELDPNVIGQNPPEDHAILFEDATLTWNVNQRPTLKNLSLGVKQRTLVAFVGPPGSGKSSKLSALMGDMYKLEGAIYLKGSTVFLAQQPWIQNATLEENILFKSIKDNRRYQEVLEACSLSRDVTMLPEGDQTRVGEKGIDLNSSQKQRINLARAVYQDKDIYLLDNPLDCVPTQEARRIFQKVIGPNGLLKDKVRILVTENTTFLAEADHVVFMKNGSIVEQGSYQELAALEGEFASFLEFLEQRRGHENTMDPIEDHCEQSAPQWHRQQSDGNSTRSRGQTMMDEEASHHRQVPCRLYLDYLRDIGCAVVVLFILISFLRVAIEVGAGVWIALWSSDLFSLEKEMRLMVYGTFILGQGFLVVASIFWQLYGTRRASAKLHQRILLSILKAPLSLFETVSADSLLNRLAHDMESVDKEIPSVINFWMDTFLWIIAVFIILSASFPYILLSIIPAAALCYVIQTVYIPTSLQLRHLSRTSRPPIDQHFRESTEGASSIRGFAAEREFLSQAHSLVDSHVNSELMTMVIGKWLTVNLNLLGATVVLVTSLLAVSQKDSAYIGDATKLGLTALSVTYALQMSQRFSILGKFGSRLESGLSSVERLKEYTELEQEAPWRDRDSQPPPYWPVEGAISIRNLIVNYGEGIEPMLKNINLRIAPGEKVAIVDQAGSGRTSLVLALLRFVEASEGSIHIDGIDIGEIGLHDLRSRVTVIPQSPVIFSGTLFTNLDPWQQCRDRELWDALSKVDLDFFVSSLRDQLDHPVVEGGGDLLGVEKKHMISVARAILRRTRIVVFEEPTTAMDPETEEKIKTVVRNNFANNTMLILINRMQTAMEYNRVIVLSEGKLVEEGNPRLLIQLRTSVFRAMASDAGIL